MMIKEETNYKYQAENFNHISFSFDSNHQQEKQPRKTIDQYLRLKTNQSKEENSNIAKKRSSYKRSLKSEEGETQNQFNMQLKNDEQILRIQSLVKQYQLKLAKQEEFFSLREWKLKQEIENLTLQIRNLNEQVRKLKAIGKNKNAHCSLCSNGQVINHLTSVLRQVEQNHRNCLDNKKQMTRQLENSNGKLSILQEQHDKIYQQCKLLSRQIRNNNSQINQLQEQKNQLKEAFTKKQNEWLNQQLSYENYIQELSKKINEMQNCKQEDNIINSKATACSVLTKKQNINGSFINSRPESQKKRHSISSKIIVKQDELSQNPYNNHRKMSALSNSQFHQTKLSSKANSLMYKFF